MRKIKAQCLVVQHVAFEDLGRYAPVLSERGFSIDYRQAGIQALSHEEWRNAELVIILGGPIGVYEQATYPWLTEELAGLAARLAARKPTLGICLGAQLMAAALGARVYPGPAQEISWSPVDLSEAGQASCLAALAGVTVLHWHGDTFDLPSGARRLASTPHTEQQAFAVGQYALALQFHPEVDPSSFERWLIGHASELAHAGISVPGLRTQAAEVGEDSARAARLMLTRWLNVNFPAQDSVD